VKSGAVSEKVPIKTSVHGGKDIYIGEWVLELFGDRGSEGEVGSTGDGVRWRGTKYTP
jgi:hypothetical protein